MTSSDRFSPQSGRCCGVQGRQAPEGSPLRADLVEVSEIAQTTLDKVRSLSQALHPVTLEEAGLESTVDWYLPMVERQNGIVIHYRRRAPRFRWRAAPVFTFIACCRKR